ncbi:MAG: hypothetical protein AAGC73_06875 [Verrucomicrobiota bacterium]
MDPKAKDTDPWSVATFDGAKKAQNEEDRERSFQDAIRWCCEMSELIRRQAIEEGRTPPALQHDRYR